MIIKCIKMPTGSKLSASGFFDFARKYVEDNSKLGFGESIMIYVEEQQFGHYSELFIFQQLDSLVLMNEELSFEKKKGEDGDLKKLYKIAS